MGELFRIQYDGAGNELDPDEPNSIENSEQFNSREQAGTGAQINANQHQFRMRVGADVEHALFLADAQEKIANFGDELDRIEVLKASGESIDKSTRKHLTGIMTDITIAWVDRAGGALNDPELEALRARVGELIGK